MDLLLGAGDSVNFVTSVDGNDLVVMCISTDGKEKWKKKVGTVVKTNGEGNLASPSPSTDGKNIWVYFGTGETNGFPTGQPIRTLRGHRGWVRGCTDDEIWCPSRREVDVERGLAL